jgi:hypothetical protein
MRLERTLVSNARRPPGRKRPVQPARALTARSSPRSLPIGSAACVTHRPSRYGWGLSSTSSSAKEPALPSYSPDASVTKLHLGAVAFIRCFGQDLGAPR